LLMGQLVMLKVFQSQNHIGFNMITWCTHLLTYL
jgi:hypothetical protein